MLERGRDRSFMSGIIPRNCRWPDSPSHCDNWRSSVKSDCVGVSLTGPMAFNLLH